MTASGQRHLRVAVSVGTHEQGFPRLLSAVSTALSHGWNERGEWRLQVGPERFKGPAGAQVVSALPFDSMTDWLNWADVLVSQASPGNVFTAIRHGAQPLVLPRQRRLNEHVDDHQLLFADHALKNRLCLTFQDGRSLVEQLATCDAEPDETRRQRLAILDRQSQLRTRMWSDRVRDLVEQMSALPRRL